MTRNNAGQTGGILGIGTLGDRDPLGQDPRGQVFFGTGSSAMMIHWDRNPSQGSLGSETLGDEDFKDGDLGDRNPWGRRSKGSWEMRTLGHGDRLELGMSIVEQQNALRQSPR